VSFLEKIVTARRRAIAELKGTPFAERGDDVRDFRAALAAPGMSMIAEVKRRSPSKGDLSPGLDPAELARSYERGGARAISVLTEPDFFGGSADDLVRARSATTLPVLWKDFVFDPIQVAHARSCGADAILLIVRILDDELGALIADVRSQGLCPLVEVFDEDDLELALAAGADVVGVNHRDLSTFEEDPGATKRLRPLIPAGVLVVGASAIASRSDVEALESIDVDAILVAESLVTSADPEAKIRELLGQ
jgi:indole-3-glycerol phosphate synthase